MKSIKRPDKCAEAKVPRLDARAAVGRRALDEGIRIGRWYGGKSGANPETSVRLLYDDDRIYVSFHVREDRILARHLNIQEQVCQDSCVEFFFSNGASEYLNFEMNCIGTFLCYKCRPGRIFDREPFGLRDADFRIRTSLPRGVSIPEPVKCPPEGYTVEYSIPFSFINGTLGGSPPRSGNVWRCNFYKCGDHLPEPHWGSWAELPSDRLDFHRPECFGNLIFV